MIRITHYRHKCIGCCACVEAAPERWKISRKDGKCNLVEGKSRKDVYSVVVNDLELEENKRAAENCPVNIIRITPAK